MTPLFIIFVFLTTWWGCQARRLQQAPSVAGVLPPHPSLADYYVEIQDGDFVLGCNTFPISGWNMWEIMEMGAGVPQLTGSQLPNGTRGPEMLTQIMDDAVEAKFTVVRGWAHGVAERYPTYINGTLNEGLFKGLDFALHEARKRGIRMILSFTSNWTPVGGVDEFAGSPGTPGTASNHADFFLKSEPKERYKSYVAGVLNRVNTINGIAYKNDPTVLAWGLINEPVCRNCPAGTVAAWTEEMMDYVRSLGTKQLVYVGEEGFWSTTQEYLSANPRNDGSEWAAEYTQDFSEDHVFTSFAGFHGWPDLWSGRSLDWFQNTWIPAHIKAGDTLDKPVMLDEFGKIDGQREDFFKAAFDAVEGSLKAGRSLKGALFWQWYGPGQQASLGEGGGGGKFGVYTSDPAFQLAKENAATVRSYVRPASTCSSSKAPSPILKDCPPGYEGPECAEDINECARMDGCASSAICINSEGSFECACPLGTNGDPTGDGGCSEDTEGIATALDLFWNDPDGQACDKGKDVRMPELAAGWVEDVSGYYDRNPAFQGGYGARGAVTLGQCAVACVEAGEDCESFTYNSVTQGCFLKQYQCPKNNGCQEELTCQSVNDTGGTISKNCGSWTTYWRKELKDSEDEYCARVAAFEGQ